MPPKPKLIKLHAEARAEVQDSLMVLEPIRGLTTLWSAAAIKRGRGATRLWGGKPFEFTRASAGLMAKPGRLSFSIG